MKNFSDTLIAIAVLAISFILWIISCVIQSTIVFFIEADIKYHLQHNTESTKKYKSLVDRKKLVESAAFRILIILILALVFGVIYIFRCHTY